MSGSLRHDRTTMSSLEVVVRMLAAVSASGALLGILVGGVGGRLAMALLASQNPEATGIQSDDGFTIGQFTVSGTIQLLATSLQLGLVGGLVYLLVRRLTLGPRWLRATSLAAGGAVVFAALLIDPEGVDFTVLDPDWLPVALFITIPAVFVLLLALLAERWLAPDSWFATAPLRKVAGLLLVWIPAGPLIVLGVAALGVGTGWRHVATTLSEGTKRIGAWVARGLLGVIGVWALVALVADLDAVT